jgi:hypothetical protein
MPVGYAIVDPRTVRGPDAQAHDVLDAISSLTWTEQLCPLMRHEYAIQQRSPRWAWDVLSTMLRAGNPDSFRAYFRGYQTANRYWDAPDGLRYWRGNRFEIDRGQADDAGLRRVAAGAKRADGWAGPPHAPDGAGLYEQDEKGKWWPTEAALQAGFQPCRSCELTGRKAAIVKTPVDPAPAVALIASAEARSRADHGRPLTRNGLAELIRNFPDCERDAGSPSDDMRTLLEPRNTGQSGASGNAEAPTGEGSVPKAQVVRKLLELRAQEAPLGSSGYRGLLTQGAIAAVAGVPLRTVTQAAIALDRELMDTRLEQVE